MSTRPLRIAALLSALVSALLVAACSTTGMSTTSATPPTANETNSRAQLERDARAALNQLYASSPRARELRTHATAILIFPGILKAGLLVGGSGGNGVLFSHDGRVLGYYNASSVSYGLQAGAQQYSEAMFLMTHEATRYLDSSDGWSVGAGPSVVVADSGMGTDLSTTTARSDVYAFIYGQEGLMAGLGVQGQKITRLSN
ncbi:lipid-binding SYLF domain-containing protein [Burkholderia sp. Ax-1719]|uniref:lipid-binding SYLF domain-containing protein n=1 Tax=Burkholderia sp. Ax-1719 TaxID=2608334 RepID=UPI00141D970C|nr:lipid-binding SYLF domain-containing protein [Burkholderia sp. Ax-1719]NIE67689.1 lipid-binding SYLF domain-containing protein [Burkholderia sp. Ax-1719]